MVENISPRERIEPRLLQEIVRLEAAGQQELPIPIIIQYARELGPLVPPVAGGRDDPGKARAQADRQDLLQRLATMGDARNLQYLVLANAVETRLTAAQIREIAGHPDVKFILWNREERVTA